MLLTNNYFVAIFCNRNLDTGSSCLGKLPSASIGEQVLKKLIYHSTGEIVNGILKMGFQTTTPTLAMPTLIMLNQLNF